MNERTKETIFIISIYLSLMLLIAGAFYFGTKLRDQKEIKIYEEWKEWSGHVDMPFSVFKDLRRNDRLPTKK